MSVGGYPLAYPAGPSTQNLFQPRRASAGMPLTYDRPPPASSPRRYTSFEDYPPPRSAPVYRDGFHPRGHSFRPHYYSRSPSPERRNEPVRNSEPEPWDRSASRQPSTKVSWDRRSLTLSPTSSAVSRDRIRSDSAASRMFEPSNAWKQNQSERGPSPRMSSYRETRASSPERAVIRSPVARSPSFPTRGDYYRSDQNSRSVGRVADTYRPGASPTQRRKGSFYRPNDLYRENNSRSSSRSGSRHSSRSPSRSRSRPRARSPSYSRSRSPSRKWTSKSRRSPSRERSHSRGRQSSSRSTSRSSIASTHASDNAPSRRASPIATTVANPVLKPPPGAQPPARHALAADPLPPIPGIGNHAGPPTEAKDSLKRARGDSLEEGEIANDKSDIILPRPQVVHAHEISRPQGADTEPSTRKATHPTWDVEPTPPPMMDVELPISKPLASVHEAEPQATSRVDATPNESRDPRRLPVPTLDSNVSIPFAPVAERLPVPPPPVSSSGSRIDYAFEDIPRFSDARSIADALRTVIMTRLLRDHQTREERVNPILMENLSLTHAEDAYPATMKTQGQLVEVVSRQRFNHSTDDPFVAAKSWLVGRFERRQVALSAKLKSLQQEYQSRHASWRRHCNILDQQAKPVEVTEVAPAPGRTTRRSAALGDTVRSDLEMEQIIASLGYDEATDPNQLSTRNLATIPDMLTGESRYTFDDTNHLVENPHEYYAPCTGIHDWTEQEKERFLDAYAKNPKQFGLIADQLPNKTASQCVDYYYLHKKRLIDFRRVVSQFAPKRGRRRAGRQKGNGLLSDIRQHDAEVHRGSDDSGLYIARPARGRPRAMPESRKPSARRSAYGIDYTETATPTPEPESEGRPKRRRVSAISRNVYFQEDGDEDTDGEPKKKKRGRKPKAAVADDSPVPTPPAMDLQSNFIQSTMQWSLEDKALFLTLVKQHGPNFKRIAIAMPDKTTAQVSDYYHSLDVGTMLADALRKGVDEGRLLPGHSTPMGAGASSAHSPSVSVSAVPETTAPTDASVADDSASKESSPAPQLADDEPVDGNKMWDSMDPVSRAASAAPSADQPSKGDTNANSSGIDAAKPTSDKEPASKYGLGSSLWPPGATPPGHQPVPYAPPGSRPATMSPYTVPYSYYMPPFPSTTYHPPYSSQKS